MLTGPEAAKLIASTGFKQAWADLWQVCPWATAFQRPEFVDAWIRSYGHHYDPVLVTATDSKDQLVGLLPLALDRRSQKLVGAGSYHAEYQTWLHTADQVSFPTTAIQAVRDRFRGQSIHLKYVPADTELSGLLHHPDLGRLVSVLRHQRPLMQFAVAGDPGNKHRTAKRRLNQLKRLGAVRFRFVAGPDELRDILPSLTVFYDLRQGALHGGTPFHDDPDKIGFHETLFETMGELVMVCVLELDSAPIAGLFSLVTRKTAHNCVIAHSPLLARLSPGSVLIMMLAEAGPTHGIAQLDLTPGGDPWKERYANRHDEVSELLIHASGRDVFAHRRRARLLALGKKALATVGLAPAQVRRAASALAERRRPGALAAALRNRVWQRRELRVYRMALPAGVVADDLMRRDCLRDLLLFQPAERWQTRQGFFAGALHRLESGEHVYTLSQNGQLVHFGWLIDEQQEAHCGEVEQPFTFPLGSVVLYDFFTAPSARGRGHYQRALRQMIGAANAIGDARHVYITVPADNRPSRHVIEKVGFTFLGSLHSRRILGSVRRWRDTGLSPEPAREPPG